MKILDKNLMIRASAGSGKTWQLSNRVIGLVACHEVDPERIVALTFTRKAAGEFADAVLEKLAAATLEEGRRQALEEALGGQLDAGSILERVTRALPRLALGTMDSFFTRVVRGFQYELGVTGGNFELLEGPQRNARLTELLGGLVGDRLEGEAAVNFLSAFRRATMGREQKGVADQLLGFFDTWLGLWREQGDALLEGLDKTFGALPQVDDWGREKHRLVGALRSALAQTKWTRKGQPEAMAEALVKIESHSIGSGSLNAGNAFLKGMLEWDGRSPLVLKYYKEVTPDPLAAEQLRAVLDLAAGCELAAAVERSRAVWQLVATFDELCQRELRRRGLLGFDDIKELMGEWLKSEAGRLRREAVDFRLDARYDHWLLDEFQDTSKAQWLGLFPWLQEAAAAGEGTTFIVGDAKQAIYGWRGGEVGLFDEARRQLSPHQETMPVSRRSCQTVLDLVNRVAGDRRAISEVWGERLATRWISEWEHHLPADENLIGHVRVEVAEDQDSETRHARVIEILGELGVAEHHLSCGVLVRTNSQVIALADRLRAAGYQVVEEGRRRPTTDHVVGVALRALVAWLADPADGFERETVAMSPLADLVHERYGAAWQARWEGLLAEATALGFGGMLEGLIEPLRHGMSDFGHGRAMDLVRALEVFDAAGGGGPREALAVIEGLELAQEPGAAAVQVMTIHKAKGLGFDVVILPEVSDEQEPNARHFEIAEGEGWAILPPASWARDRFAPLRSALAAWEERQRYEALCLLYVSLTRARQGLYVVLPIVPDSRDSEGWGSAAHLLRLGCGTGGQAAGVVFEEGDPAWAAGLPTRQPKSVGPPILLGKGLPRRARSTPSDEKRGASTAVGSAGGRAFGSAVHECFERVGWVDEETPELPPSDAGVRVAELLTIPAIRSRLERRGREVALFREQPVEAIVDGKWLSGVIDRLHVFEGGSRVELIDFKTDAVDSAQVLRERYAGQMKAYRKVLAQIYPQAEIEVLLLALKFGDWVEMDGENSAG